MNDISKHNDDYPIITLDQLQYAYDKPTVSAVFKAQSSDFVVNETLSFELEGEGPHAYLFIEKTNTNTEWLARQLARFAHTEVKQIGYAGLKDRQAITSQWFSVNLEGIAEPQWDEFQLDGVNIKQLTRHRKKLKRGAIAANHFQIKLRDIDLTKLNDIKDKIALIKQQGVPNYFGEQRFGHDNNNLTRAALWFNRQRKIKKRSEKSIILSAVRSMIFNAMLSERMKQHAWNHIIDGDVMMLRGSRSVFTPEAIDDELKQRFKAGDIHPTAALWGRGRLSVQGEVLRLEESVAQQLSLWCNGIEQQGLQQERRATRVIPDDLITTIDEEESTLTLAFALPSGTYATAVLRELLNVHP